MVVPKVSQRLFDKYLFADYSGGGEHRHAQPNIRLYLGTGDKGPDRLYTPTGRNFSRESLRHRVIEELDSATAKGERVIFGMDHQYSWPTTLWKRAGLSDDKWRSATVELSAGNGKRPDLD